MKKTNTDLALNGNNQPEVADVFHLYGENYRKYNPVSYEQRKAMHHIEVCRTAELGGHVEQCDQCSFERIETCGFGDLDIPIASDPLLLPLAYYGGPTPTAPPAIGSAAIDPNWEFGSCVEFLDQRGVARPKDGDSDGL